MARSFRGWGEGWGDGGLSLDRLPNCPAAFWTRDVTILARSSLKSVKLWDSQTPDTCH